MIEEKNLLSMTKAICQESLIWQYQRMFYNQQHFVMLSLSVRFHPIWGGVLSQSRSPC